jgi:DNA-binding transcriptional ArsR family regulator
MEDVGLTIDISGLGPAGHRFAASPLAELAAMLHVLVEPSHHPDREDWVTATRESLDPELDRRLAAAGFLLRSSRADFLLPAQPSTLVGELDEVDAIDDEAWVAAALLTTSCGSVPYEPGSPLTDARLRDKALQQAASRGAQQVTLVSWILDAPQAARGWVRQLFEDCAAAFFAKAWTALLPDLVSDARHKRDLLAWHGLDTAINAVSPLLGHRAGWLSVDKLQDATADAREGMTYLPSAFGEPHLLVVHAPGWRPVIQYPLARQPLDLPSLDAIQRRTRALSHPVRLRLLRTLARGPHTTTELAGAWGLTAPEVSRHLALLKEAGIVTTERRGHFVMYELDVAATSRLGADILESLLR